MNIIITSNLKTYYPELALPTIRSYTSNITKVLDLIESTNIDDLFLKYDKIIKKVKEDYPEIGTRKCKYSSCVSYIKTLLTDEDNKRNKKIIEARTKYNIEIDIIKKETIKKLSKFEKTKHEEDAWLNPEEIKLIDDNLYNKVSFNEINTLDELKHFRNLVIFRFYTEIANRCELSISKLYYNSEVDNIDNLNKEYNYIILDKSNKNILYIKNQHKNKNKKGSNSVLITNNELYDLIDKYKKQVEKFNTDKWFLLNDSGLKNISYSGLSILYSTFGDIIKKKISIRVNRKIQTSNVVNIGDIINVSDRLGHSVHESIHIYSKK